MTSSSFANGESGLSVRNKINANFLGLDNDVAGKLGTTLTSGNLFVGNASNIATSIALSGHATINNTGVLTLADEAVSLAKMANVATGTVFYRKTIGTGVPEVQTLTTLKTDLSLVKADVGLGNVVNADTTTTANITDASNKRFITDAQQTVLGNTSGTNTGDNATNTTSNTYADGKVADAITDGVTTIAPSQNAVFDALAGKQATLQSGTNIKTINGDSILGSGNLVITGGSGITNAQSIVNALIFG